MANVFGYWTRAGVCDLSVELRSRVCNRKPHKKQYSQNHVDDNVSAFERVLQSDGYGCDFQGIP